MTMDRTLFAEAMQTIVEAQRLASTLADRLPRFEDDPCDCGEGPLCVVEPGYERWSRVALDESYSDTEYDENDEPVVIARYLRASSNGWSDFGEHGAFEYLYCATERGGCGRTWRIPEDLDWD